jgi:hypothetical protein
MADESDGPVIARLKRDIADLQTRLQLVRQETADQVKNALEEQIASLEQDAAASRERLREVQRENLNLFGLLRSRSLAGPEQMVVEPFWPSTAVRIDRNGAFLIMPFRPAWADSVRATVGKALASVGVRCNRADDLSGRTVMADIWKGICECGIVIADLTDSNANVTYELGLADAVGQPAVLICQTADPGALPFDFLGQRLIIYSVDRLDLLESQLIERVRTHRSKIASTR